MADAPQFSYPCKYCGQKLQLRGVKVVNARGVDRGKEHGWCAPRRKIEAQRANQSPPEPPAAA